MKNLTICQSVSHRDGMVIHESTEKCPLCRAQDEVDELTRKLHTANESIAVLVEHEVD
jgi:hypothetical protein